MRFICFIIMALITLVEIGPMPITPILLLWVIMFRPIWFYHLVVKIYGNKIPDNPFLTKRNR